MVYSEDNTKREGKTETSLQKVYSHAQKRSQGAVMSKHGYYNPTSLAVEGSLKAIFDEYQDIITQELRMISTDMHDKPSS